MNQALGMGKSRKTRKQIVIDLGSACRVLDMKDVSLRIEKGYVYLGLRF
jgi:hypothetical protein